MKITDVEAIIVRQPDGITFIGDGTQDIAAHLAAMEKYDFTGPITLEVTMEEYADAPDESYEKSLQVLQQLWK